MSVLDMYQNFPIIQALNVWVMSSVGHVLEHFHQDQPNSQCIIVWVSVSARHVSELSHHSSSQCMGVV